MDTSIFLLMVAAIGGFWLVVARFVAGGGKTPQTGARLLAAGAVGAIGMIVSFAVLFTLGRAPEPAKAQRVGMAACSGIDVKPCDAVQSRRI